MRILRIEAPRYAHISGLALDLPRDAALHLVFGPNEAGKSTLLGALGDALFGFPHRSAADFLHPPAELRVGLEVEDEAGARLRFTRRKGNRSTLAGADGGLLPDAALAPFLRGLDRAAFERLFGLDGARLRAGGEALARSGGDATEGLAAAAGLGRVRHELDRLKAEAKALWGGDGRNKGAKVREHHRAWNDAQQAVNVASLKPAEWAAAARRLDDAEAALRDAREQDRALKEEASRLRRRSEAAPNLAALDRARANLAEVAGARSLERAELDRMRQALVEWGEQEAEGRRQREEAAQLDERLAALRCDPEMEAAAPALERLFDQLSAVRGNRNALPAAREDEAELAERLCAAARALGRAEDPEALLAALPKPGALKRLADALELRVELDAAARAARTQREAAAKRLHDLAVRLDALPEPPPSGPLREAVAEVERRGDLDAALHADTGKAAAARGAARVALAALPRWSGDAAALAALALPLPATEQDAARHLAGAIAAHAGRCDEHRDLGDRRATAEATMAGLEAGGAPPTREAVAAARTERDAALEACRLALAAGQPGAEAWADHARLRDAADSLADRRADDAEAVAAYAEARRSAAEAAARLADLAPRLAAAATEEDAARQAWCHLWPPGVEPGTPAEMVEWRRLRAAALDAAAAADTADAARDAAGAAHTLARRMLCHALAQAARAAGDVASLLAEARAERDRRGRDETARADLAKQITSAREAVPDDGAADADEAGWRAAWPPLLIAAGLAEGLAPPEARAALDAWKAVEAAGKTWRKAWTRTEGLSQAVEEFAAAVGALPLSPAPELEGLEALRPRLAEAQAAAASRQTWIEDRDRRLAQAATAESLAREARLASISLGGVIGPLEALRDALARSERKAAASMEVETLSRALDARGVAEAALRQECEGFDPDAARARLDAIDHDSGALADALERLGGERRSAADALAVLDEGRGAAGHRRAAEEAGAAARDAAEHYARLRLAAALLERGLEHFRSEQQDPLLQAASGLFAELTGGQHARLLAEEEDGRRTLLAVGGDGRQCRMEDLSEGTRDQLFLALRLAAVDQRGEAVPFVADDLLASFDDDRARLALGMLARRPGQTILLTHHRHLLDLAGGMAGVSLHAMPGAADRAA